LQDTDTFVAAPVVLTLATAVNEIVLLSGVIVDIMSNNNTSPGITTIDFAGTFENFAAYAQTVQFSTGHIGLSRFVLLFTREVQGGAYPCLVQINPATLQIGDDADASDVTAVAHTLTATVQSSVPGTSVRVEGLSPVSELWYGAIDAWYADAAAYAPRRTT
jgi:hypothetical protein